MCGKEEFDLLVETDDIKKAQELIQEKGFGRFGIGPIVGGEGYCRSKKKYGIICELHLLPKGHKKIKCKEFSIQPGTGGGASLSCSYRSMKNSCTQKEPTRAKRASLQFVTGGGRFLFEKYLHLIHKLKNNPDILRKYEELKRSLDGSTEEAYKKGKSKFLKENKLI